MEFPIKYKFGIFIIFYYFCNQENMFYRKITKFIYMNQEYFENDIYQDAFFYQAPAEQINWAPNLFAKLVNYLQFSTSPDVIRMGIIAGVRDAAPSELETPTTWDKVEYMRRYVDSVNRGLGLPDDSNLISLLHSSSWTGYGLFSMNYISEMNLDYKGICQDEQTNLSYASMAFLIALVKGMSMLNLKKPKALDDDNHIYTLLIPNQFASFSFASFLNVASNRLSGKDNITKEEQDDLINLSFKKRYWKMESSLKGKDSELFIFVLKNIISDILGIHLDFDTDSFTQQAKKEELIAATPKGVTLSEKELTTQNISIAKAVEIVLTKYNLPQTRETILNDIIQYRPDTKEDSLRTIIGQLHRGAILNYYEGGLIGIKGKRYGRGYKVVNRLQKVKSPSTE